jgi:serine/threonine-protein phosphatase 2B catalytic subunit
LLWSDPVDDKKIQKTTWKDNKVRQCSFEFGYQPVKNFLQKNNFMSVIRAHQVMPDGYKMHRWGGSQAFPVCITIFSAPNYCGSHGNKGAVITITDQGKFGIKQYKDVDHPYHLPGDIDLFEWSLPYLIDKTKEILNAANKRAIAADKVRNKDVEKINFNELFESEILSKYGGAAAQGKLKKWRELRAKMRAWARFLRILRVLRENAKEIALLKAKYPGGKLPHWTLVGGRFSTN